MRITGLSIVGRDLLAAWEGGYRTESYLDVAGIPTISAGVTAYDDKPTMRVKMGDKLPDVAAAKELFAKRLKRYEADTDSLTRDDLKASEFDACCMFLYNVGASAYAKSTLARLVNNGENSTARITEEFLKWNFAGGRRVKGLWRRRRAEAFVYCEGIYYGPSAHEIDPPA